MTFDYDLSNMSVSEANLWIYLHTDSISADILARGAGLPGIHSIKAARDVSGYCQAAKEASGIVGARSYPLMRDN
ncbi:MAG TPA: hypothetical protein VKM93_19245 [Terriglobia bacterium]|nr:hypothetical protein [Terriglobia bacterium]